MRNKILKFSIFESNVKEGFKYSEDEIKEELYYLTDLGFKIEKIKSYYATYNDDSRIDKYDVNMIDATKSVHNIILKKEIGDNRFLELDKGGFPRKTETYYFNNNIDNLVNIISEVASFCDHFKEDDIYHNISYDNNSIVIQIYIYCDIPEEDKKSREESIIKKKSESEVDSGIFNFLIKFTSDKKFGITSAFSKAQKDKLGEYLDNYYGSLSSGCIIKFFNTTGVSKSVINTNFKRIEDLISISNWYIPVAFHTIEFRKVTEDDLKKLKVNYSLEELKQKFLGLDAVILNIDYNKWLNSVKKRLSK